MTIQSLKRLIKSFLTILILIGLISCTNPNKFVRISEIGSALKIEGTGYVFFEGSLFRINEHQFSLLNKATYDINGDIKKFIQFKSEGILEYNKDEIHNDPAIIENAGYPLHQKWSYENNKLFKDNQIIDVIVVGDSLLQSIGKERFLYYKLR